MTELSAAQTIAPWIAASGTVLATSLAVVTVSVQQWDRRRARGVAVSAWESVGPEGITLVCLRNSGQDPAFEVVARLRIAGQTLALAMSHALPPDSTAEVSVNPTQPWRLREHWDYIQRVKEPDGPDPRAVVTLTFRDAAGRAWQRDDHGRVRRLRGRRARRYSMLGAYRDAIRELLVSPSAKPPSDVDFA
ncbi:hypothetical protein [Kineococcus rhizosphaerae]|uniref:hypothetical protein n=1 Tax=Kineococcus rhizosphaerae TaxID=559628 RepID=UPI000D079A59|nr:hypothetical protein [Kineococcus rhizosphaerae]